MKAGNGGSYEGDAEADSQELHDLAIAGLVWRSYQRCWSSEEDGSCRACSSGTGQYQGYKGGVFDLSNSLLIFASFFMFMLSVAGGHLGFLVRGGEWVEYPYVKKCSLKSSIYIRYSLQIHIPYNQDTFPILKSVRIVGVLLYYNFAVTRFEVPTSFCLDFD